jgi:DNA-binding transcriptional regulator YiaG
VKVTVEARIIEGLEEFSEALRNRDNLEERFVVHRLTRQQFSTAMVKKARALLGVSPTLFAAFLGVSPKTVRAWEKGTTLPNRMACRFYGRNQQESRFLPATHETRSDPAT